MLDLQELSEKGILFDGHYKLLRPLSTDGATADVWLAVDINTIDSELGDEEEKNEDTGMRVAIKIYRPKNALDIEGEQRFRDEYKIVYECRHANLLQPTGFSIYGENPYLVLPFCENGSSEKLIGKKLTEDEIWKYISDVSSGLDRLHTNTPQIVHQDIKPANILIDNMHNYAITDFGISSKRGGVHGYYYDDGNSGTMAYMAPERFLEDAEPMAQSDIWAFGATLYEILTGKVPFGEDGGKKQPKGSVQLPQIPNVPASVHRLICACLDYEPGSRPTAKELMEAARYRVFPVKRRKIPIIILSSAVIMLAGFFAWQLAHKTLEENVVSEPIPIDETFALCSEMMKSDIFDTFIVGYQMMDTLCQLQYVPAMYEIAFTIGWYSDSESCRRKDLLGIEYEQKDPYKRYLPMDDNLNQKAIYLMQNILDISDSSFALLNGEAAYRLAGYYTNGTLLKQNDKLAEEYLDKASGWAALAGDEQLITRVENAKKTFN